MNKFLLFCASAALLAACSQEETVDKQQGGEISFRQSVTRGAATTISNLANFKVKAFNATDVYNSTSLTYGFTSNYFTSLQFSKGTTAVGSNWEYRSTVKKYWPDNTNGLVFLALSPTSTQNNIDVSDLKDFLNPYTVPASEAESQDVILAIGRGNKDANETSGVPLTFHHALSQVIVKAKNGANYTVKVKDVAICQVAKTANADIFTKDANGAVNGFNTTFATTGKFSWTFPTTGKTYGEFKLANAMTTPIILSSTPQELVAGSSFFMIPQQLTKAQKGDFVSATAVAGKAYIALLVQITEDGTQLYPATTGSYGWAAVGIDTNWEQGKTYTYILDFSNGGGIVPPGPDVPVIDDEDDPVLGGEIFCTCAVSDGVDAWTSVADETIEMPKAN